MTGIFYTHNIPVEFVLPYFNIPVWYIRFVIHAFRDNLRMKQKTAVDTKNALAIWDREKRNLARELHDGVCQDFAKIKIDLETVLSRQKKFEIHPLIRPPSLISTSRV